MALSDPYATAAEYRAVVNRSDVSADAQILTDLTAVSRYLEKKLGRFFNKDTGDVTRTYLIPAASDRLWIDDLSAAPTSITIDLNGNGSFADETALISTDYELYPYNAALEPEPEPYTAIRLTQWGRIGVWPALQRVRVTGRFGWPSVPAAIKSGCIQLTAILRLETPRATARVPELDQAFAASPEAQGIINKLLDGYKRGGIWFA
jgi:hypothetical protein